MLFTLRESAFDKGSYSEIIKPCASALYLYQITEKPTFVG
jgi:hypothetical protein